MSDLSNQLQTQMSLEDGVKIMLHNARQGISHRFHECENRVRRSPTTAVVGAVAVGYLLHRLPMRAILVTQVRVLTALTPPVLLMFGAAKLYEFLQRQETAGRH